MFDENWPASTPRDEMLARVAARGSRIRAVRGAMNALAILSVVGMSAFGVAAAVDVLHDTDGTEVDNIALVPEPPEIGAGEIDDGNPGTGTAGPTTGNDAGPGTSSSTPTSGSGTTGVPTTTAPTGGAGATGGGSPGSGTGGRGPSTPGTSTTTTVNRPTTTRPGTTTTTTSLPTSPTIDAPQVENVRMKDSIGAPMAMNICEEDANAVLSVEIRNAETATLSWNRAGATRSEPLTAGAVEWSAPIREIDAQSGDVPVVITIEATGPGGTTRTSTTITVGDCSPLPSDPPVPGP